MGKTKKTVRERETERKREREGTVLERETERKRKREGEGTVLERETERERKRKRKREREGVGLSTGKAKTFIRLKGSITFRQRLLLAALSTKPVVISDIHSDDTFPGLRPHEVSLLRLIEKLSDGCYIEINETGTKVRYEPGTLMGGGNLVHDCGLTRSIGYFLEPLILLGLFGRKPLFIRLTGITNDSMDPSIDTFRLSTLHILKRFGVPLEGFELKIISRGSPPLGGGEVAIKIPIVRTSLSATQWIDVGKVKRIRGVSFTTKVSAQFENRMIYAARGLFNRFIPDVHIFTDHKTGPYSGRSPGYGITVVAETTSGCLLSASTSMSHPKVDDTNALEDDRKPELMTAEDVGVRVASMLLEEIKQGGVVDSTHQGFLFVLCALCPPDVSKIRVGKLTPYGIETLRNIREFLGIMFYITPDPTTKTVLLKCVGCGMKNLSRRVT